MKKILIPLLCLLPFFGNAWSLLGHRIVGEIAESYLTRTAKKKITAILGTESIAMSANWADFIRSDSSFNYLTPWHYDDIPGGMSHAQFMGYLATDTTVNAYTKLNFLIDQLKNHRAELSADMQLMYLRLLIHIVGDVHQPLHTGHPEDKGGNSIRVKWFNEATNLHHVWDQNLIDYQELSYTEYTAAINHPTPQQIALWQKQPLSDWIWDNYTLAAKVYADVSPEQKLGYDYNFKYIGIVNEQLLKGGIHLAALLNDIFG